MKTCSRCKEAKPLDAFHKSAAGKYGVTNNCKACMKLYAAVNSDKARARAAAWRAANPERARAQYEEQVASGRRAANAAAWRAANPDKVKANSDKNSARQTELVTRSYVASKLRIPVAELTPELYETKRAAILLGRIRKLKRLLG